MTFAFYCILGLYATLLVFLFAFQRKLIYHPDTAIGSPAQYGLAGFKEYFTETSDKVRIQLWYHPAVQGFPTIVYYHGNAYHMGSRAGIYAALADKGFGVLGVSYRGYGKSEGYPSEQGIYRDARAAIAFLAREQHITPRHIILYGESLGSGVAVQMATEYPAGALVLQAAYTSVAGRAAEIYPFVPVQWMIRDRFDSLPKMASVHMPLLLFHGELDNVIPIAHGKAIYDAARSPKAAIFFPHTNHNDFDSSLISAHLLDFATAHHLIDD